MGGGRPASPEGNETVRPLSFEHFLCDERHGHRAGQPAQKAKWAIGSPISSLLTPLPSARSRRLAAVPGPLGSSIRLLETSSLPEARLQLSKGAGEVAFFWRERRLHPSPLSSSKAWVKVPNSQHYGICSAAAS